MSLWREFSHIYYAYASLTGSIQLFLNRIIAFIELQPKNVLTMEDDLLRRKEVVSVTFDTDSLIKKVKLKCCGI